MHFTAVFQRVAEGYIGFVEELPGANTQGATLEETRANLSEAVELVLEANRNPVRGIHPRAGSDSRAAHARGSMKRLELIRHLEKHGCALLRKGGRHTGYVNRASRKSTTVPRHREVDDYLARKICRDLDVREL